jgi:hypothetical protein
LIRALSKIDKPKYAKTLSKFLIKNDKVFAKMIRKLIKNPYHLSKTLSNSLSKSF